MCTLIARWSREQEPAFDEPKYVHWGDGRPATQQDYLLFITR
jgi:hypothetical protein